MYVCMYVQYVLCTAVAACLAYRLAKLEVTATVKEITHGKRLMRGVFFVYYCDIENSTKTMSNRVVYSKMGGCAVRSCRRFGGGVGWGTGCIETPFPKYSPQPPGSYLNARMSITHAFVTMERISGV